jgi:pimeloyl-ACP methyl ester carboxylesterase
MTQTETGYVEVNGGRLPYEVAGEGHPLVLIHAGIANKSMWDEQWEEFARHFRVIRYDMRGFGDFKTEDVQYSNRQDLRDLLDHLGIQSAYVLGVSRGSMIATDFTLEFPERVAALILVAVGLGGYPYQELEIPAHEEELSAQIEEAEEAKDLERLTDLEVRFWVDGPGQSTNRVNPQLRERVREMIAANYREHTTGGQPIVLDPPAYGRLQEIQVPTLVIVGDCDTSDTLAVADVLAERIPNARKEIFHDAAHLPSMEQPEAFSQLVTDFLKSVEQ